MEIETNIHNCLNEQFIKSICFHVSKINRINDENGKPTDLWEIPCTKCPRIAVIRQDSPKDISSSFTFVREYYKYTTQ